MKKDLLKNRNFLLMLIADAIGRFGDSIDAIAMSWLTYEITNSPSLSALNFAINFIPSVIFQPFCGAYVEKRNHRRIMIIADVLRSLLVLLIGLLLKAGKLSTVVIMLVTFLISTIEAFRLPCQTAIIPRILKKEEFSAGQSLSTTCNSLFEFVGSALAGALIALLSLSGTILLDASCFLSGAFILFFMSYSNTLEKQENTDVIKDTMEGLKYLSQRKDIISVCLIAVSINALFTVFMSLRSAVCVELFNSGPILLSVISTALMIGNIFGSIIYPALEKKLSINIRLAFCYLSIALFYINVLLSYRIGLNAFTYLLLFIAPFLLGISMAMINIFSMVYLLKIVPEEYISRITAAVIAICLTGQPLTAFLVSVLTKHFSIISIFTVMVILALSGALIMSRSKSFSDISIN